MSGFLIFMSMVTGTASFIALFRPLPRIGLPTRKRAAVVWRLPERTCSLRNSAPFFLLTLVFAGCDRPTEPDWPVYLEIREMTVGPSSPLKKSAILKKVIASSYRPFLDWLK